MTICTSKTAETITSEIFCRHVANGRPFLMTIRSRLMTLGWIWLSDLFHSNWIQKYAILRLFQSLFLLFWLVWLGLYPTLLVKLSILLIQLLYILFAENRAFTIRCNFPFIWASKWFVCMFWATVLAVFTFATFMLCLFDCGHIKIFRFAFFIEILTWSFVLDGTWGFIFVGWVEHWAKVIVWDIFADSEGSYFIRPWYCTVELFLFVCKHCLFFL